MKAEEIGKRLEILIGDKDKKQVATDLNVSYSALRMYLTGKRVPKDEVKVRIARYFNKTVDEIFFADDEHETYSNKEVG
ncbi:MAG: helix-turn-helix transcriptional regulator [Clostridiales Family XIII bacterium]|uniref:helix-turn-helix transcriptional regulator n=1 Tax=Hominibacterium faecale TaxID=2839743 RepID=UPI0022B298DD|nr:helix-turn-helix transcriptional regulator [Hominibacterium faecale]MCI7301002.1 helix-turn-helix transcriptional regulator [Clostridia bacterium]MDY3012387.1 helix-turn-helix transcriptional regulator [Clostridiales Family XIII bacterium]